MKGAPRWVAATAVGIGVIALVVVALSRQAPQLDYDTPEGAVQEYLRAISVEDYEAAFAVLHEESFAGCDADDLARNVPSDPFSARLNEDVEDGFRGEFFGEEPGFPTIPDDSVTVNVILEFGTPGLLGGTWQSWESFLLIERDGDWWIIGDPWPYFSWGCRRVEG